MRTLPIRPIAAFLLVALLPAAAATHVEPEFVPGPGNETCSDFAEGADWLELKVEPAVDGTYMSGPVTITVDADGTQKTFSWASNVPIAAVFVKAGDAGHHLYRYDPAALSDAGLTTPGEGATENQISHISFCFEAPPCEPGTPDCPPPCEPGMPGCPEPCEPGTPGCPPPCEPGMPGCPEPCEPGMPGCPTPCEPGMPGCPEPECPATFTTTANDDGSVTVHVDTDATFELHRAEAGGEFELVGTFTGDTVWNDTNTTNGSAYVYRIVVAGEVCEGTPVVAIPFFPNAWAALLAVTLSVGGFALMRRKK